MDRLELKAALAVSDAGEITGIAWPFGVPDSVGDLIERGAFNPSAAMPILFEHDTGRVVGTWHTAVETDAGLEVKGRLFLDSVPLAREVHALIKRGRANGLSIGFRATETKTRADGNRTIIALDLAEISIVANPSHPDARVLTIKSAGVAAVPNIQGNIMENALPAQTPEYLDLETKVAAVADSVKTVLKLTDRLDKLELKLNRPAAANSNVPTGDNDNHIETKAFGSFIRRGVERMPAEETKALTVAVDANGGYLAPDEFIGGILKKLVEFSPIRQYAKVISISTSEIKQPRRLTGTAAMWVDEIADRTESGMTFEQAVFTPHELATFVDVSTQLLEDNAYNLEGELQEDFSESFGKTEAAAFVSGDGTGKPKGLLAATGIAEIKSGTAATLGTNVASTVIALYHKLQSAFAQNGV